MSLQPQQQLAGQGVNDPFVKASLHQYMTEAKKIPLLSREEEIELATRYRTSQCKASWDRLVSANLRLVVKVAYQHHRQTHNVLDLVQEGNIGLMNAIKRYDPKYNVKLSSYAVWWIKAYIYKYLMNNARQVRIGTTQMERRLFYQMRGVIREMLAAGIEPSNEALAKHFETDADKIQWMRVRLSDKELSAQSVISDRGEGEDKEIVLQDTLRDTEELADGKVASSQLQQTLSALLVEFAKTLTERERFIFERRVMQGEGAHSLQQLGDRFEISRERCRQIEVAVVEKVRLFLKRRLGTEFSVELLR